MVQEGRRSPTTAGWSFIREVIDAKPASYLGGVLWQQLVRLLIGSSRVQYAYPRDDSREWVDKRGTVVYRRYPRVEGSALDPVGKFGSRLNPPTPSAGRARTHRLEDIQGIGQ